MIKDEKRLTAGLISGGEAFATAEFPISSFLAAVFNQLVRLYRKKSDFKP